MKDKPDLQEVQQAVVEAKDLTEIGSGGFKVVYKATVSGKAEAIKLAQIPADEDDESVRDENLRRIKRELDIIARCKSPNLVKLGSISPRVCELNTIEYMLYSEEYVPGESLRTVIQTGYRPTAQELAEMGICLLNAVQELATMKVIHRDIKPDNIMRTGEPSRPYVLLDLGIAFQVGGTRFTRDSVRIPGTLYYIAPEMLDQGFRQNLDYRADLYTIGLTMYEFATGENPFAKSNVPQFTTLYRIKTIKPKPLRDLRGDLPVQLCGLLDQLIRKLPALRPANFAQLNKEMERYR